MASRRYQKIFITRFLTYFMSIGGFVWFILWAEPVVFAEIAYRKDQVLNIQRTVAPNVVTAITGAEPSPSPGSSAKPGNVGFDTVASSEKFITPVSTDYGIVVEKINANAVIIPDVDPGNEKQYMEALSQGVAVAKGSTNPGQPGNLYIFSHSTDAPWNIIRFNAIFYLLRELETGDRVLIFYQGRRYDYIVYEKGVVQPGDLSALNNQYDKPVLTLQTCDPPGTTLNRLIIKARLVSS